MLARVFLDGQRYDDAIDLQEPTPYFVNWEGQTITWDIFNKAHLERGKNEAAAGLKTPDLGLLSVVWREGAAGPAGLG